MMMLLLLGQAGYADGRRLEEAAAFVAAAEEALCLAAINSFVHTVRSRHGDLEQGRQRTALKAVKIVWSFEFTSVIDVTDGN